MACGTISKHSGAHKSHSRVRLYYILVFVRGRCLLLGYQVGTGDWGAPLGTPQSSDHKRYGAVHSELHIFYGRLASLRLFHVMREKTKTRVLIRKNKRLCESAQIGKSQTRQQQQTPPDESTSWLRKALPVCYSELHELQSSRALLRATTTVVDAVRM